MKYIDNGDGTVTDTSTGLMWQKETHQTLEGNWEEAIIYCKVLSLGGYTDWRLPAIKELLSLVNYELQVPAIDITYFQNTILYWYWSSTVCSDNINFAWSVDFCHGSSEDNNKNNDCYVRAVRGGV